MRMYMHAIKVTPLSSATKYHQFDPGGPLGVFIAPVYRNLVHIYIEVGQCFKSCDANHPVLDRIGHNIRLLECIASVHRELLDNEINQFREGMQYLERRHRSKEVLKKCRFPVKQIICSGDAHDIYGN